MAARKKVEVQGVRGMGDCMDGRQVYKQVQGGIARHARRERETLLLPQFSFLPALEGGCDHVRK